MKKSIAILMTAMLILGNVTDGTSMVFAEEINEGQYAEVISMDAEELSNQEDVEAAIEDAEKDEILDTDEETVLLQSGSEVVVNDANALCDALTEEGTTKTITLGGDIEIGERNDGIIVNSTKKLDLAGHTLSIVYGNNQTLDVSGSFTVTGNGKISCLCISIEQDGCLILNDARLTMDQGVHVSNGASFKMLGGSITGCRTYPVFNCGTFTMNGGSIYENESCVYNKGTMIFNDGSIHDNEEGIQNRENGVLTMNGGSVTANGIRTANENGGVCSSGGGVFSIENSRMYLVDGNIDENNNFGVFLSENSQIDMAGGTISNNNGFGAELQGKAKFSLNGGIVQANKESGIKVEDSGCELMIKDGRIIDNSEITSASFAI